MECSTASIGSVGSLGSDGTLSPRPSGSDTAFYTGLLELIAQNVFMEGRSDLSSFYRRVCRLAADSLGARGAVIFLTESGGRSIISISAFDAAHIQIPGRRFTAGQGVAGATLASGRIELHSCSKPHPSYIEAASGRFDDVIVAVPIQRAGEAIEGVLCFHNPTEDDDFSAAAVEQAGLMGSALAHALRIARFGDHLHLSNEILRASAERTSALYSLATEVLDGYRIEEVLDEAVRAVVRLFHFERIGVFLTSGTRLVLTASVSLPERFSPGASFSLDQLALEDLDGGDAHRTGADPMVAAAATALRHRRTTLLGGRLNGEKASMSAPTAMSPARSVPRGPVCAIPLEADGRSFGAMVVARALEDDRPISDAEIASLRYFSSQIALLVDQAVRRDESAGSRRTEPAVRPPSLFESAGEWKPGTPREFEA